MDNENVTGIGATSRKKAQKEATLQAQFVVKTNGYQETFRNQVDAKNQYDILKKRTVKNQAPIKLELAQVDGNGSKKVLENVTIGEDFFR